MAKTKKKRNTCLNYMNLSITQKAVIAISELKQTLISIEVQKNRAEEIVNSLSSRINSIRRRLAELKSQAKIRRKP